MDELFRFVALRPPTPSSNAIILDAASPLAIKLTAARDGPNARDEMQSLAQSYVQSDDFVWNASTLNLRLDQLADAFEQTERAVDLNAGDLIERTLGSSAARIVESHEFKEDLTRLGDSMLAMKLALPEEDDTSIVLRLLGAANIVLRVASGRENFGDSKGRFVLLPTSIFPLPPKPTDVSPPTETFRNSAEQTQQDLVTRAKALAEALQALGVADQITETSVSSNVQELKNIRAEGFPAQLRGVEAIVQGSVPSSNRTSDLLLDTVVASKLAPTVRQTLTELGINPVRMPLPSILHTLNIALGATLSEVKPKAGLSPHLIEALGSYSPYKPLIEPQPHDDSEDQKPVVLTMAPVTHGAVKPAGIADLLVVRQHVLGYAPGEVAYVENVAAGETLVRTTRRSEMIEDVAVTVNETTREQERDVQATDRFDLRRESSEVLRSDSTRKPGNLDSPAYGVVVETGNSAEHAQRTAETFGRDVATQAVSRVTERLRTETTHRRIQEFSEEVRHTFDNSIGESHEILVYQWLDRLIQAQVFTYGKRLFYDLVLPEPAVLVLRGLAKRHVPDGPLIKPAPFTLGASEINKVNYLYYVAGYGATGVEPPPEPKVVITEPFSQVAANAFAEQPEQSQLHSVESRKITISPGYRAVKARIGNHWYAFDGGVNHWATIGTKTWQLDDPREIMLDGETGTVAISIATTQKMILYTTNIEIWCELTERRMDEWRQRTYDAILLASRQRMGEYQERSANLRASIRMDALNFTSDRKRSMEREELQRGCLAVLTNQQFDGLSGIEHSSQGYPQPFLPNVEPLGRYVRFLQQAFEWDQMTWRYYPYFWGRKQYWLDKLLLDDNDPQFRDFLRAGSARVLLSVRPGFEGAVAHFMDTGLIPTAEELGQVASKLYLPFLMEEMGPDVAIENATPYGEPWQLRAPTALVKLRSSKTLPTWTSVADAKGRIDWAPGAGDSF